MPPAGPDDPDRRRRHALLLGGVVAAAAGLRLAALDLDAFWLDEATTAVISRADPGHLVVQRARSGHPPLFFLLTWAIARLAGNGEVAMRLPAALAGIASVPLLHAVVRRVAGPRAALLAAAFLALSPTHLELSLMARAYSLVAFFGLAATLVLVAEGRSLTSPSLTPALFTPAFLNPVAFGALHLAAVFCHYSALLVVAVHGVWALYRRRWRFAAAAAAVGVAVVPWLAWVRGLGLRPGGPLAWVPPFGETTVPHLAVDLVVDIRGWGVLEVWLGAAGGSAVGLGLVAVLVALAAAGAVRARGEARLLGWLWLGPPALVLAAVAAGSANGLHEARWFLLSSIAFSGLLGMGVAGLGAAGFGAGGLAGRGFAQDGLEEGGLAEEGVGEDRRGEDRLAEDRPASAGTRRVWRRRAVAAAVAAVLAGGCALELAQPEGTDWRTVARVLEEEKRPGEELLVLPDAEFRLTTLRFYRPAPFRRLGERPWRRDRPPGVWVAWSPGAFEAVRLRDPRAAADAERELRRLRRRLPLERRYPLRAGTLLHLGPALGTAPPALRRR